MRWTEIVGDTDTAMTEASSNIYTRYREMMDKSAADVRAAYAAMRAEEEAGASKDAAFDKHYPAIQAANKLENEANQLKDTHLAPFKYKLAGADNLIQHGDPSGKAKFKAARTALSQEESKFSSGGKARKIGSDERNMDF